MLLPSIFRSRAAVAAIGGVAVVTALGGGAVAYAGGSANATAAPTKLVACAPLGGGTMRTISAAASCKPGETRLTWSVAGPKGATGATGAKGATGATGAEGATGATGAAGIAGAAGTAGKDGATGAQGIAGTNGVQGDKGADGTNGTSGTPGTAGLNGVDGKDGIDGKDGVAGLPGKDGVDGKNGLPGKDGVDGKDASADYIIVKATPDTSNQSYYQTYDVSCTDGRVATAAWSEYPEGTTIPSSSRGPFGGGESAVAVTATTVRFSGVFGTYTYDDEAGQNVYNSLGRTLFVQCSAIDVSDPVAVEAVQVNDLRG